MISNAIVAIGRHLTAEPDRLSCSPSLESARVVKSVEPAGLTGLGDVGILR
jgi:hypothetical protein